MADERLAEAWDAMRHLVTDEPTFTPAYRSLVEIAIELERLTDATEFFDKRVVAEPGDAFARYGRGLVAGQMGELDEALARFERACELRPDFPDVMDDRGGLGFVYVRSGEARRRAERRARLSRPPSGGQPLTMASPGCVSGAASRTRP